MEVLFNDMKIILRGILIIIGLWSFPSAIWAQNMRVLGEHSQKQLEEVLTMHDALIKAYEDEDILCLETMLSNNHLHNNVFGMSIPREPFLNDIRTGTLVFEYYRVPELEVRFYGSNSNICVLTGRIEAKAQRKNQVIEGNFRFTRILVFEDGQWKEELFQNTHVPER